MLHDGPIKEVQGDLPRKWISDDFFDLIIWFKGGSVVGFQLCYDKSKNERALTWRAGDKYSHRRVDAGEDSPFSNRTPVLVPDGVFAKHIVISEFTKRSVELTPGIRDLVLEKLEQYSKA